MSILLFFSKTCEDVENALISDIPLRFADSYMGNTFE